MKNTWRIILAVGMVALLGACSAKGTNQSKDSSSSSKKVTKVKKATSHKKADTSSVVSSNESESTSTAESSSQVSESQNSESVAQPAENENGAPITFEEAQTLLTNNGLRFKDETELFTNSGMSNQVSLDGGGIEVKQFGGAQGIDLFKLTPKPNNMVYITAQYGSIKDGQLGETAPIAQEMTVSR